MCNLINTHTYTHTYTHTHTHTHTHTLPPWEDQREWHRMTRMTRPDCAVMCNLINTHTHIHTQTWNIIRIDTIFEFHVPTISSVSFFIFIFFRRGISIFLTSFFRQSTKSPLEKRKEKKDTVLKNFLYAVRTRC